MRRKRNVRYKSRYKRNGNVRKRWFCWVSNISKTSNPSTHFFPFSLHQCDQNSSHQSSCRYVLRYTFRVILTFRYVLLLASSSLLFYFVRQQKKELINDQSLFITHPYSVLFAMLPCLSLVQSDKQYPVPYVATTYDWARLCLGTSRALPLHPGRSLTPTPCVKALPLQSVKGLCPLNSCPTKQKGTFFKWEWSFLCSIGCYELFTQFIVKLITFHFMFHRFHKTSFIKYHPTRFKKQIDNIVLNIFPITN